MLKEIIYKAAKYIKRIRKNGEEHLTKISVVICNTIKLMVMKKEEKELNQILDKIKQHLLVVQIMLLYVMENV